MNKKERDKLWAGDRAKIKKTGESAVIRYFSDESAVGVSPDSDPGEILVFHYRELEV